MGQNKRNVLFIAEPQDDSFVLFPQASEPSMNFHILKLVYCKLDFKFQSSDVIESAVSYFTLFCSKIKSLEPAWSCQELFITSKQSIHLVTVSISLSVSSPSSGCSTVVSSMLSSMVWADSRELNRTAVSSSRLTPPSSACIQKFTIVHKKLIVKVDSQRL